MHMILKPQDIVILLKLVALGPQPWSYQSLAGELAMSPSEVHSGIRRATQARLFDPHRHIPILKALQEFLVHGLRLLSALLNFSPQQFRPTHAHQKRSWNSY